MLDLGSVIPPALFFFKIVLIILMPLFFHINISITFSISKKILLEF